MSEEVLIFLCTVLKPGALVRATWYSVILILDNELPWLMELMRLMGIINFSF